MTTIYDIFYQTMEHEYYFSFTEHSHFYKKVMNELMGIENEESDEESNDDDYNQWRFDYYTKNDEDYDDNDKLYGDFDDWEDYYDSVYN